MFTLDQIIKMEQSLSTRKLPVDIEKMMDRRRWSENDNSYVRVGDLPLHRILRAWHKETRDAG